MADKEKTSAAPVPADETTTTVPVTQASGGVGPGILIAIVGAALVGGLGIGGVGGFALASATHDDRRPAIAEQGGLPGQPGQLQGGQNGMPGPLPQGGHPGGGWQGPPNGGQQGQDGGPTQQGDSDSSDPGSDSGDDSN